MTHKRGKNAVTTGNSFSVDCPAMQLSVGYVFAIDVEAQRLSSHHQHHACAAWRLPGRPSTQRDVIFRTLLLGNEGQAILA